MAELVEVNQADVAAVAGKPSEAYEEREILRHTLGLDRSDVAYRNFFSAGPSHSDTPALERLVAKGHMVKETSRLSPDFMFRCTKEGRDWLRALGEQANRESSK